MPFVERNNMQKTTTFGYGWGLFAGPRWTMIWLVCMIATTSYAAERTDDRTAESDVMPGVVVVQFNAEVHVPDGAAKTGLAVFDAMAARHQVYALEKALPFLDQVAAKRTLSERAAALQRTYLIRYSAPRRAREVAAALARDPNVAFAEPYFIRRITEEGLRSEDALAQRLATPNDTRFSSMAHLLLLRLPEAWDVVKGEQGDVVIAVIDGGTDWRHPDLEANVWTNPGEVDGNGIDDDGNGFVDDIHGWNFATSTETSNGTPDPTGLSTLPRNALHGTAVAGAAAAVTDNTLGVAGTSWNTQFMAVNAACPTQDRSICFGFPGILYAAMNGADIINASWGGDEVSQFEGQIIEAAVEQGALVVAASGNEGRNTDRLPFYPASYPAVLSVGGTRKNADIEGGFNYGKAVNVYAPGLGIDTTTPDGQYLQVSGTSFSSPLVAGVAALVKTLQPAYTPHQVREQVRLTSDAIDDLNPNFRDRLGRGRVNAERAVTETGSPAIRLLRWTFQDEDGNLDIRNQEKVQVTATFINYLDDASNLTVALDSDDPFISFPSGSASVGALASGDSATVTFEFELAANTPNNRTLILFTRATDGAYVDAADIIRLPANVTSVASHNSGALQVSITDQGNLGYLSFQGGSPGIGFVTNGRDILFEGGLLIGTGPASVSDCVRGTRTDRDQDEDLVLKDGTVVEVIRPGPMTAELGRVELTDAGAPTPIGVSILQESLLDTVAMNQDFIILHYEVTNTTASRIENLHVGLFFDWDVNSIDPSQDVSRFNDTQNMGYILDDGNNPTAAVGLKVLTNDVSVSYQAIDNPQDIYRNETAGGFTEEEKWTFMSGGIQRKTLGATDASHLIGAGPFAIDPGSSVQVAFAVVTGRNEGDLLHNGINAQMLWDGLPVGVDDEAPVPGTFALKPVYPHPAVPPVTFEYEVATTSDVHLDLYDVLGRKVQTLTAGRKGVGAFTVVWDGTDPAGRRVAPGLYIARLTAEGATSTRTQSRPVVVVW